MLRFSLVILLSLTMSCGIKEENPDYVDRTNNSLDAAASSPLAYTRDEVWICHHPGTKMHNQLCIELEFPDGCYIAGNRLAFCWLLMRPECERYYDNEESLAWQEDVCHHLE